MWDVHAMLTFSPTLLTLVGISAGTYIGFKFPGKLGLAASCAVRHGQPLDQGPI